MPRMRKDQRLKKQHRQSFSSFQCKVGVHQPGRTRWGGILWSHVWFTFVIFLTFLPNHSFNRVQLQVLKAVKGSKWDDDSIDQLLAAADASGDGQLQVEDCMWELRRVPGEYRKKVSRSCPSPTCHRSKKTFPPWDRSHEIPDSGHDDRMQFDYGALKLLNVHRTFC